jgi:hypothetical protein
MCSYHKLQFIPIIWWLIIEITTTNKFPKLKPLLVPKQSLRLRLHGSGVALMSTFCWYLCTTQHSILFELPGFCEFHALMHVSGAFAVFVVSVGPPVAGRLVSARKGVLHLLHRCALH